MSEAELRELVSSQRSAEKKRGRAYRSRKVESGMARFSIYVPFDQVEAVRTAVKQYLATASISGSVGEADEGARS